MRDDIINYVKSLNLNSVTVTTDLPFDDSGVALYLKNVKKIYIDREQITSEPIVQTLDAVTINNTTTSVSLYFTIDAKQVLSNYTDIVNGLKAAKDVTSFAGVNNRTAEVATEYLNDLLVTTVTITLTRIN